MTAIINNKRVLGPQRDIMEVTNAIEAYNKLLDLDPTNISDLLLAHGLLMKYLSYDPGTFRMQGVGIYNGDQLIHMPPSAKMIPQLIDDLFGWLKTSDAHPLIKSCVFHYEFEFIHPFSDGNGRMGRMWQTLILYQWRPLFGWLPVESIIKQRQLEYYQCLKQCDIDANCTLFIEFMLENILLALNEYALNDHEYRIKEQSEQVSVQLSEQVERLLELMDNSKYSSNQLMALVGLKHRPTFQKNYLKPALSLGLIHSTHPDKPNSSLQKYFKIKSHQS